MTCAMLLFLAVVLQAADPVQLVPIEGPWKAHPGDDMRWAAPDFDDAGWESLQPPESGMGFAWHRRKIRVPHELAAPIWLWFPGLPPETEVYANGRLVLRYGEPGKWYTARGGPVPAIELPELSPDTVVTIALRIYRTTASSTMFLRGNWKAPLLGSRRGIALAVNEDQSERLRLQTGWLGVGLLNLLFALAAFGIWRGQRDQPVYFWFAAVSLTQAIYGVCRFAVYVQNVPMFWLLPAYSLWGAEIACWLFLFRGDSPGAGWRKLWPFLTFYPFTIAYFWLSYAGIIEDVWIHLFILPLLLSTAWIAWRAVRLDPSKRLLFYTWLVYEAGQFVISVTALWTVFTHQDVSDQGLILIRTPFEIDLLLAGALLSVVAMSVILLARFAHVVKERETYAGELEAARQVQELLVPAAAVRVPGFDTESAYLPAQRVGGDFFQILPATNGGVLVIVGDVSGKGLRAAMVVSLVVGALRSRRSDEPRVILSELNEVLCGQMGGGFVTCCCARFDFSGALTVANAGHPSPYGDGGEVEMETGLPLGIAPGVAYDEFTVSGSQFTFVSDGVVEAENAQRELFGFERTREISTKSAQEIAEAAKAWGQNDDITVVTVRRNA